MTGMVLALGTAACFDFSALRRSAPTVAPDLAAASSPYWMAVLADAPVAYWRMGIASGSVVPDETSAQNPLLLQGGGHVLALPGALEKDPDTSIGFDGVGSFAVPERPRAFDFPAGHPFSLEVWAHRDAASGGNPQQTLVSAADAPQDDYSIYFYDDGWTAFTFEAPVDGGNMASQGPPLMRGVWTHAVASYDGQTTTLYLNGDRYGPDPTVSTVELHGGHFTIGSAFRGTLDEIAVYDHALSAAQVLHHRDVGLAR
jgi:hypothetical protein